MKYLILLAAILIQLFSAQNLETDDTLVLTLTHDEKAYLTNKKNIKMCVDPDWMPFERIENSKHIGLAADYMHLIRQKVDIPITLVPTSTWSEAIEKAKSRECDIFSIISITPEREKYLNFTSPFIDVPIVIATVSTELFVEDINQILDKKIGIAKGYSVGVFLKQKYPNIKIVEVDSGNDGLRRVEKGEIFCYIDNLASIVYEIQKNFIGTVHISGRLDTRIPYRIATRNDEPILNDIFEKAVLSIDATTKQQILTKWTKVENITEIDYILMGELAAIVLLIIIGILYRQRILKREHIKLQIAFDRIQKEKEKLKNQKKIYELIFDNAADGILILDNGKFTDCNDSIVKMLKYDKKEDILNLHPAQFSPERQLDGRLSSEKADEMIALAYKNRGHRFEWIHKRSTGEDFWAEIVLKPVVVDEKEILYVVWRDISERKKLEYKNAMLQERMELALSGYNAGVYEWNLLDNSAYYSPQWKEMLGYDKDDELPGILSIWIDRVHPDDTEAIMLNVQETLDAKKEHIETVHRLKHKNGQWIWILGRGIIQYDHNGKALRMVGIHTDITEQNALQLQSVHQAQIIEQINDSVISTDLDAIIVSWNAGSEQLFGYRADEAIGKHISMIHRPEDIPAFKESLVTLMETGGYSADAYFVKKSKEIISVEYSLSLLRDENGVPTNMIGYAHDITVRKKAEKALKKLNSNLEEKIKYEVQKNRQKDQQLIYQSRLAQMGEMISMIAHQWRQPLAAISSTSALLELKAEHNKLTNDLIIKKVRSISNYSQHLSETINDFRNFFKPNKEKKETTYDEVVKSVLEIIEVSITNKNIQLLQELNCHEPFSTYPNELKQVILNLIKNAEDILLYKAVEDPTIKIATYTKEDKYILEVSDNAGGIPEKIMDKIFDPYFSTKKSKDGIGLGLYMSKIIIEEHCGGTLSIVNINKGALFKTVLNKMHDEKEDHNG